MDTQRAVFKRFDVKTIPALVYLKNGKPMHKEYGKKSAQHIQDKVTQYLK